MNTSIFTMPARRAKANHGVTRCIACQGPLRGQVLVRHQTYMFPRIPSAFCSISCYNDWEIDASSSPEELNPLEVLADEGIKLEGADPDE